MKIIFFIVSGVTFLIVFFAVRYETNSKIEFYLERQTKLFSSLFDEHYKNYLQTSQVLYDIMIKNKEVLSIYKQLQIANQDTKDILRKKLYQQLSKNYNDLQYVQLKQLHFHLQNGDSFLRMHLPLEYGDNLVKYRETIAFMKKNKKKINGFEIGKVYSGLRFVYPIFNQKEYLGSVEISYDIAIFSSEFMKNFDVLSNVYLKKLYVDQNVWEVKKQEHYKQSDLQEYYFEKNTNNLYKQYRLHFIEKNNKEKKDAKSIEKYLENLQLAKRTSFYDEGSESVITVLPIINPISKTNIGFFAIQSFDKYIPNKLLNSYFVFINLMLLLLSIYYLLFKILHNKNTLNTLLAQKVKEETLALNTNKKLLEDAQKMAKIGSWEYNIKENTLVWSDETYRICEIEKKEYQDLTFEKFLNMIHYDNGFDFYNSYTHHLETKEPYFFINKIVTKNSNIKYIEERCTTTYDTNNNPIKSIGTMQDITVQYTTQKELDKKNKQLQQQIKMVSMTEMLENIAHQWRQPLFGISAILANIDMKINKNKKLQSFKECEAFNTFIEYLETKNKKILQYTNYLSNTIDTFREFLTHTKEYKKSLLQKKINNAIELINESFKQNTITLINNIEKREDLYVTIIPGEFIQVIINILKNSQEALIANKIQNPWIKIDLYKQSTFAVIVIEDNAKGIDEKIIEHIFEPYFTTKEKSQGIGLGLHIAYKIITQSSHGELNAKNTKNGAQFQIKLPLHIKE